MVQKRSKLKYPLADQIKLNYLDVKLAKTASLSTKVKPMIAVRVGVKRSTHIAVSWRKAMTTMTTTALINLVTIGIWFTT